MATHVPCGAACSAPQALAGRNQNLLRMRNQRQEVACAHGRPIAATSSEGTFLNMHFLFWLRGGRGLQEPRAQVGSDQQALN